MGFLEKDLEDLVYESTKEDLKKRGLFTYKNKKRQLSIGNYGCADLVTWSRDDCLYGNTLLVDVIELKKDKIDMYAFLQAIRYAKGISRYFDYRKIYEYRIDITLVGKSIDKGDFLYLSDVITTNEFSLSIYTYEYRLDGIYFNEKSSYRLTNEGWGSEDE